MPCIAPLRAAPSVQDAVVAQDAVASSGRPMPLELPLRGCASAPVFDPVLAVRMTRHAWRGDKAGLRAEALFGALNLTPDLGAILLRDTVHF